MKTTKEELIEQLKQIAILAEDDREEAHLQADELLLDYIDDEGIRKAYESFDKWYA